MQQQKLAFMKTTQKDFNNIYNRHKLVKPVSPYEVQAGTLIPSVLFTSINTSLPGEVVLVLCGRWNEREYMGAFPGKKIELCMAVFSVCCCAVCVCLSCCKVASFACSAASDFFSAANSASSDSELVC